MSRFIFKSVLHQALASLILLCFVIQVNNQVYCSAYCSYFNQGNTYAPMCTGTSSVECTKCDDVLFTLVNNTCTPHGYFNESLHFKDLIPPMGVTLADWSSVTNLYRINTQPGPYELVEFYTGNAPGVGGDDKIFKQFTNLPPHYNVRLRFFVLRSGSSGISLNYYINHNKYHYDISQFPTSATLGDIVNTDKIFHQQKNLTVAFQAQLIGLNLFIGIKELLIFISKCSENCQLCNSSQNCVKCMTMPNGKKTYLHDGYCYVECPQTSFQNDTLYTCDKCQSQCQNCQFNSTFCTQCKSEGRFKTFLYNSTCHYNCPNGFFKNFDTNECTCPIDGFFVDVNHTCQTCIPQCNSCFGPNRNMCYNCSAGNYLIYATTECSKTCPAGQYGDEFAKKCELCSPLCSQCEETSSKCKACFLGLTVRYLYDSQCVVECPRGYGRNLNLRKCEKCSAYFYSYKGECILQCPQMYVPNNESKSCLYIGQTNYSIYPRVVTIQLLPDGKALSFHLSFSEGLTESSKNWISLQAYYNIVLKKDGFSTSPTSVALENNYTISLVFPLNEELTQSSELYIEFAAQMNTTKSINYAKTTKTFRISEYPQFLAEYLKEGSKSFFNLLIIPIVLTLIILVSLRLKGTYDLFTESIRLFQFVGLAVFLDYPLEGPIYSVLEGLNYFNFEFFPNIYNWFVPKFDNSLGNDVFSGFSFIYGDMDFIRMIGSILVFIAVWIVVILVLKYFVVKKIEILGWVLRLGMDLVEIKIMHSFWNSVIFTFANSQKENIYMLWVHFVSYIFMGLVAFRYYKIYQSNGSINYPFAWRLISTLFISIAIFNKMIVLILLSLISVGFGLRQFYTSREQNKQLQTFRFGIAFLMRDTLMSLLPWLSVMAVCMITFYKEQMKCISAIIVLGTFTYFLIIFEVLIFILMRYFLNRRQKTGLENEKKQNQNGQEEYNKVERHGTLSSVSQSFNEDNESYIKDEFVADFGDAHRQMIPYQNNSNQNDSNIRTTIEKTLINSSAATKIQVLTQQVQNRELKIEYIGQNYSKLYPRQSNRDSIILDHDEELFESKKKRAQRTEALKRKEGKVQPLQTLSLRKVSQTQFEHITLKKVDQENEPDRQKINQSDMVKKPSTTVIRAENKSSPRLNTKPSYMKTIKQESRNSKLSQDQNIFVNEDY